MHALNKKQQQFLVWPQAHDESMAKVSSRVGLQWETRTKRTRESADSAAAAKHCATIRVRRHASRKDASRESPHKDPRWRRVCVNTRSGAIGHFAAGRDAGCNMPHAGRISATSLHRHGASGPDPVNNTGGAVDRCPPMLVQTNTPTKLLQPRRRTHPFSAKCAFREGHFYTASRSSSGGFG